MLLPSKIQRALDHVREHYPEVDRVTFDESGRWVYSDALGNAPTFDYDLIDQGILEDAEYDIDEELPKTYHVDGQ